MEWSTINNCITIYDVLYGSELYNFSMLLYSFRHNFKSTSELLLLFLLDAKKVPKKEKLSSIALILCSKSILMQRTEKIQKLLFLIKKF